MYTLIPTNDGYQFVTEQGLWYEVYAVDASYVLDLPELDGHVKFFGFSHRQQADDAPRRLDKRIAQTIVAILQEQFTDERTVILFTCDQSDQREQARNQLFDNWFKTYGTDAVVKIDKEIEGLYASFLLRTDNPFYRQIMTTIDSAEDELRNEK